MTARSILHLDMDAFYASIEQLDDPELRGKPVLVGHDGPRGVVSTASYEARPFGCRSAQPMSVAKRNCPDAVVVPVRMRRYVEVSEQLFRILRDTSPLVQPLSVDEAFLDLTGTERLLGPAVKVAEDLRARVHEELGLTCSVGVAPNPFLAKLASELDKPDGLTVVPPDRVQEILDPLPIECIWGIGPATAARFRKRGVTTIGRLRQVPEELLTRSFGSAGEHYWRLARGIDERRVTPDGEAKSIGQESTFEADLESLDEVKGVLLQQTEQVCRRLRRHGRLARGAAVKIRYGDFQTVTRSVTFREPTDVTDQVWAAVRALLTRWAQKEFQPVRLIGMNVNRFTEGVAQMELFEDPDTAKHRKLDHALDLIQDRFGTRSIQRGGGS